MTPFDTSVALHVMHTTSLSVSRDVHKGIGENMDDEVTYRQQISFCGKPRCRKCQQGIGHGPYWYSYQVISGRTVRKYIGKNLPTGVQAPSSLKPLAAAVNPAALRLADMRDARESVASEIDELDRLLALDPTSEEVA